jgi:hypothetical protein
MNIFIKWFSIFVLIIISIVLFIFGAKNGSTEEVFYTLQHMITDPPSDDLSRWPPMIGSSYETNFPPEVYGRHVERRHKKYKNQILDTYPHIKENLNTGDLVESKIVPNPSEISSPLYFEYIDPVTNSTIRYIKTKQLNMAKQAIGFIVGGSITTLIAAFLFVRF